MSAYNNVIRNRTGDYRPINTGKHKQSTVQSGNAAVACLLQWIVFEAGIRRKHHLDTGNAEEAYSAGLWDLYKKQNTNVGGQLWAYEYFRELDHVRDVITHAYLFDGFIGMSEHRIVSLKEKAIGGKNKSRYPGRMTARLRIHTSPNQIGFKDAAVFYQATNLLLKLANLELPYDPWAWDDAGEEYEPHEWLKKAMNRFGYGRSAIWKELCEFIEQAEYDQFNKRLKNEGWLE